MNTETHRPKLKRFLDWVVNSWEIQLTGGLVLLISTFYYGEQTSLHHGFRGLLVLHIIGTLPNLIQAIERINKGIK